MFFPCEVWTFLMKWSTLWKGCYVLDRVLHPLIQLVVRPFKTIMVVVCCFLFSGTAHPRHNHLPRSLAFPTWGGLLRISKKCDKCLAHISIEFVPLCLHQKWCLFFSWEIHTQMMGNLTNACASGGRRHCLCETNYGGLCRWHSEVAHFDGRFCLRWFSIIGMCRGHSRSGKIG